VGDCRVGAAGDRLSEAENLNVDGWQGDIDAALPPSREDVTRRQHTGRVTFEGGFCAAGFRTKLWLERQALTVDRSDRLLRPWQASGHSCSTSA
jgi:hypothetical protein